MLRRRPARSTARLAVVLLAASVAGACAPGDTATPAVTPYELPDARIAPVACDPAAHARPDAQQLLAPGTWGIGGWNHATLTPELALPDGRYTIGGDNYTPEESCGGERVLDVVMVRKLVDWDRGHVNGFEATVRDLTFGEVADVVLEIRLVPEDTVLPTDADLVAAVGDHAEAADVEALDDQTVALGLTFYGPAGEAGSRNAGTILRLDPDELGDGWHRVRVDVSELEHWTELQYVRTPVEADEGAELAVAGLRVNPESATGETARHLILDDWEAGAVPEVLKEMRVQLALLEVGRRTT